MRSHIKIQLVATPDDLTDKIRHTIMGLQRRCFPNDRSYKVKGSWWWLAYNGQTNRPVAFIGLEPYIEIDGKRQAWIPRVGVIPKYRGQHLQRRLYKIVFNHARREGIFKVVTYTHRWNFDSTINMLKVGMRFYRPNYEWGCDGALYFEKNIR